MGMGEGRGGLPRLPDAARRELASAADALYFALMDNPLDALRQARPAPAVLLEAWRSILELEETEGWPAHAAADPALSEVVAVHFLERSEAATGCGQAAWLDQAEAVATLFAKGNEAACAERFRAVPALARPGLALGAFVALQEGDDALAERFATFLLGLDGILAHEAMLEAMLRTVPDALLRQALEGRGYRVERAASTLQVAA